MTDRRVLTLRAALGFLQLSPRAPELQLLHRWMDSWTGVGLIAVGLHRQGWDLQLTQYGDGKWRATFYVTGAPHSIVGGSAWEPTPWRAVQQACHANEGFPDAVAACGPTQAVKMPSYAGSLPRKRRRTTSAPAPARVGRGNQTTSVLGSRVS